MPDCEPQRMWFILVLSAITMVNGWSSVTISMQSEGCNPPTTMEVEFETYKTTTGTVYEHRNLCQTTMDCFLLPNSTSLGALDFIQCAEAAAAGGYNTFFDDGGDCKAHSQSFSKQWSASCTCNDVVVYSTSADPYTVPPPGNANITEIRDDDFDVTISDECTCLPELPCRTEIGSSTVEITQQGTNTGSLPYCADYSFNFTRYLGNDALDQISLEYTSEMIQAGVISNVTDAEFHVSFPDECACGLEVSCRLEFESEAYTVTNEGLVQGSLPDSCSPLQTYTVKRYVGDLELDNGTLEYSPPPIVVQPGNISDINDVEFYVSFPDECACGVDVTCKLELESGNVTITNAGWVQGTLPGYCSATDTYTVKRYVGDLVLEDNTLEYTRPPMNATVSEMLRYRMDLTMEVPSSMFLDCLNITAEDSSGNVEVLFTPTSTDVSLLCEQFFGKAKISVMNGDEVISSISDPQGDLAAHQTIWENAPAESCNVNCVTNDPNFINCTTAITVCEELGAKLLADSTVDFTTVTWGIVDMMLRPDGVWRWGDGTVVATDDASSWVNFPGPDHNCVYFHGGNKKFLPFNGATDTRDKVNCDASAD